MHHHNAGSRIWVTDKADDFEFEVSDEEIYQRYLGFIDRHGIEDELIQENDPYFSFRAYRNLILERGKKSQEIGSRCHEFLAYGLPQPMNIDDVILNVLLSIFTLLNIT